MPIPITIPRLGWNMDEGIFAGWLKQDGEAIVMGDRVFSLEGEKATEEIESLDAGTLHVPAHGPRVGDRLAVGATIGYLLQPGETVEQIADANSSPVGQVVDLAAASPSAEPVRSPSRHSETRIAISPRARRKAAARGIDWTTIKGSGRTGRIREKDIDLAIPRPERRSFRKAIAERMLGSARTTAPVTLTTTADATHLVRWRNRFKNADQAVPSYSDLLMKLVSSALRQHPRLNSRWDENDVHELAEINIGFAVDTIAGLVVPVVHDVTSLSVGEIAERSRLLIERARIGELTAADMRGGTFTITNLGAYGIDAFTPIINAPECAILGVGRIQKKPVIVDDQITIREIMTLSLTFDHRVVDGAPAARFLQTVASLIESSDPANP